LEEKNLEKKKMEIRIKDLFINLSIFFPLNRLNFVKIKEWDDESIT